MADNPDISATAIIRDQMRQSIAADRASQKQKNLSVRRRNLDEVEKDLKNERYASPDDVAKLATKIKQSSQVSHLNLRNLKQALFDMENIGSCLKVVGALQSVVGQLTGKKCLQQLEAAYVCCNLALGDEHACVSVARVAGPYLIELLDSQNIQLQEACAWTLGNLSGGSLKALEVLKSQGLLPRLMIQLNNPHNAVVDAVVYALCHIMQTASSAPCCVLSNEELQELVRTAVPLMNKFPALHWLLFHLSCSAICDNIFIEESVPFTCIEYLSKNAPYESCDIDKLRSVTGLLRTTANLLSESSGQCSMMVLNHPALLSVLNSLFCSSHSHLQKEAKWLTSNLLNHSSSCVVSAAKDLGLATYTGNA